MGPVPRSRSRIGEARFGREEVGRIHPPGIPSPTAEPAQGELAERGGVLARGVVWLGTPPSPSPEKGAGLQPRPRLELLGYLHGPRILERVRGAGR
jgi:hypothetical protein